MKSYLLILVCAFSIGAVLKRTTPTPPTPDADATGVSKLVHLGSNGKLVYEPYTEHGDVIPDFSNCGYMGGGVRIPDVAAKITLRPETGSGDDTARIQQAIDQLGNMPIGPDGFRGALVLSRGYYHIGGSLKIHASGIVLRGEGSGEGGTVLTATGNKPRAMIVVASDAKQVIVESKQSPDVTDEYVPVGARSLGAVDASQFHVGDCIIVRRIGNAAWIHELGMDDMPIQRSGTRDWKSFDIESDRVITAVNGNQITFDAPICCAIEKRWGGGEVVKYTDAERIGQIGVENLRAISEFDKSVEKKLGDTSYYADEQHATDAISFNTCKNAWARNIVAMRFVHGVAKMERGSKWITVQDSEAREPVSIITGGRRYPFNIMGQLCLVLRCRSDEERHAFVMNGSHDAGPDAFVDCTSEHNHADSGPHQRWSTGTLWDNVVGVMHTQDREDMGSGHGWAGANDVYWNCSGRITIEQPPTAQNFAFGFVGQKDKAAFTQLHHPEGWYESFGKRVQPPSLYMQQLKDRLGPRADENITPPGSH
ncbi:MAG TPA: hypothetical protein VLI90_13215 [Tepidisphaeraceae bacterium]|nr:hypothetical protein [Tepidisphaeraceae bacterium]